MKRVNFQILIFKFNKAEEYLSDLPDEPESLTKIFDVPDKLKKYHLWGPSRTSYDDICQEHFQNARSLNDSTSDINNFDLNDEIDSKLNCFWCVIL